MSTNRFYSPNQQFANAAGVPYAGGSLTFSLTGTATPANTYSESTLTTPNANPVVLDSAGRAGDIFLDNVAYKVILKDSSGNTIWTKDPVWSTDYSGVAQITAYNGNPNGFVAGTAGTQGGRPSSMVWDYANSILYVCTTSGVAAAAVWTAVNATAAASHVPYPTGYLTPTSGTPFISSEVISGTAVYYTPLLGNEVAIYNGASFVTSTFTELTLTLVASHSASTIYDVFVFNNSGVLTLVTGPAWTNSAAAAGARGTGAGTTQIARLNGINVNSVQITGRNGATTYTVAANRGTYLGSIFVDGSAGQITCHLNYGQSRKWAIWNAYNRVPLLLKAGDSTASWTYGTNTIRALNNSSSNSLTIFSGLPEDRYLFECAGGWSTNTSGAISANGIGYNSTTAASGLLANCFLGSGTTSSSQAYGRYIAPPALGINVITFLETCPNNAAGTVTAYGTEAHSILTAQWMA